MKYAFATGLRYVTLIALIFIVSVVGRVSMASDGALDAGKPVVYQVFTRLFGNQNQTNKAWGSIEENGVGKFADFTPRALREIHDLGATHIWFTGVPHHASVTDYRAYGIAADDPDVVKGRAGSPYAVRDYFNVDPDLAIEPRRRLEEFRALVERSHQAGLRVIIDIVPNHVARAYHSPQAPVGFVDFGAEDDTNHVYQRDNNFYYVVGEAFEVPNSPKGEGALGGRYLETDTAVPDGSFTEMPAKWTGNGARTAQPSHDDWYETVKLNYGVRPDGTHDFPALPEYLRHGADYAAVVDYWDQQSVPRTWRQFLQIAIFWLDQGVDGFRYDMAEMVPAEFWSYLNSHIKLRRPDSFLVAEIYNPAAYQVYLQVGRMDFLYDKVDFYDALRALMTGRATVSDLLSAEQRVRPFEQSLLRFLENHDEQRIAAPEFVGKAMPGIPAMAASALMHRGPTMLYFGQEVGEPGADSAGFGRASRTTIFDYWGVPQHQAWMNGGRFDGGSLNAQSQTLRASYHTLLNIVRGDRRMTDELEILHAHCLQHCAGYGEQQLLFSRGRGEQRMLVLINFADTEVALQLPSDLTQSSNARDLTALPASSALWDEAKGQVNMAPYSVAIWH